MLCHPTRLRSRSHRRRVVPVEEEQQQQAARPAERVIDDEPVVIAESPPGRWMPALFWLALALLVAGGVGLFLTVGVWWGVVAWAVAVACVVTSLARKWRGR